MLGAALGAGSAALRERGYALADWERNGIKPALLIDGARGLAYVGGGRQALDRAITTAGNGVRNGLDIAGRLREFPAGKLRRAYLPAIGPAILSEAAAQNILTFPGDFENVAWNKISGAVGDNPIVSSSAIAAPDGTLTADKVIMDAVGPTGECEISRSFTPLPAGDYTLSVWLRVAGGDPSATVRFRVDRSGGSFTQGNLVTEEWQRFTMSFNAATDVNKITIAKLRPAVGTSTTATLHIWGAQLETSDHVTSTIESPTGAITSRLADGLTLPLASWFTPAQGTLLFKGVFLGASGGLDRLVQLGNAGSDCLFLYYEAALSQLTCGVNVASVWQGGGSAGAYAPGDPVSCAISWNGTQISVSLNGAVAQDFAVSAMPALSDLDIGNAAGADDGTQLTQALAFWPQVDADLQGLSAWAM